MVGRVELFLLEGKLELGENFIKLDFSVRFFRERCHVRKQYKISLEMLTAGFCAGTKQIATRVSDTVTCFV